MKPLTQTDVKILPDRPAHVEYLHRKDFRDVNQTRYMRDIEDKGFYHFVRPRRFGKSMFRSTPFRYDNINFKDRYDNFFNETHWIKVKATFPSFYN